MTRLYTPTGKPFDLSRGDPQEMREEFELVANGIDAVNLNGGYTNKIIGGDFSTNPWQRGSSFPALAANAYGPDRFKASDYVTSAVVDWAASSNVPTPTLAGIAVEFSLELTVTTADSSIAAGDSYSVEHKIEGANIVSFGFGIAGTRYITLSFLHCHSVTGAYSVAIRNATNPAGTTSDRSYIAEYSQAAANVWERSEITIPVDASGTWFSNFFTGLRLTFTLACGTTKQDVKNTWLAGDKLAIAAQTNLLGVIGNKFRLALVQLEPGAVATPFEARPFDVELQLCKRYYERAQYARGVAYPDNKVPTARIQNNGSTSQTIYFNVPITEKRYSPSGATQVSSNGGGSYASGTYDQQHSSFRAVASAVAAAQYAQLGDWYSESEL